MDETASKLETYFRIVLLWVARTQLRPGAEGTGGSESILEQPTDPDNDKFSSS